MSRSLHHAAGMLTAASLALLLAVPTAAIARYDAPLRPAPSPAPAPAVAKVAPVAANAQLAADLAFMREEEKLAHDVYTVLAAKWDARIFSNIAASEQRHTDSVSVLLERYGVADPAEGRPAGVYSDPELQELYNDLVARGSVSLTEAFEVGKLIEEVDIADLKDRIARTTQADVLAVYENLLAGSQNHLAAFTRQLSGTAGGGAGGGRGRQGW